MSWLEAMETQVFFSELFHPVFRGCHRLQDIADMRIMAASTNITNVCWLRLRGRVDELFLERRRTDSRRGYLRRFWRCLCRFL